MKDELLRACSLVRFWPDGSIDERLASWIGCPDLSPHLRGELLRFLWERTPNRGAAVLRHARDTAGLVPVVRRFLVKEAHRLRGSERDFLEWATAQDADPVVSYYAVQSWESLGEDSLAWRRRLKGFAQSDDPFLRLHAVAALSRRGETSRMGEVVDTVSTADHVCVRAEALRILGELDVRQHRALLHRAVMEEPARFGSEHPERRMACGRAAFEEAGTGLMRLGPPDALTELIQCYLVFPGLHNPHQLSIAFQALMKSGEAAETADRLFEPRWRRCRGEASQQDWPDLLLAERRWGSRRTG
jgi:hypothetical protein